MVTRRSFLAHAAPLALAPWVAGCGRTGSSSSQQASLEPGGARRPAFRHGVASGDPLPTAVVLWTRVSWVASADAATADVSVGAEPAVEWLLARDVALLDIAQQGEARARADADYTVKVDVQGLLPGATYYYQFRVGGVASPVGRTRTAPEGHVERLRVAVTSCACYPQGYFHAYRKIAERPDLDLVLYLGDYIYEYENRRFGDGEPLGRVPDPDREIISLDDYRRRHAQYKLDPDLQEVHRQHPAVVVWDDHEFADNAYSGGAYNHSPGAEGDWQERKAAAMRAYHEWMPIRSGLSPDALGRIYRVLPFGDLVDLIMLDTRVAGRDPLVEDTCHAAAIADPARSILGAEQEGWLFAELTRSRARGARFRFIGQQVALGQFLGDPPAAGCIGSRDKWSAYAASRARVLEHIRAGGIDNVVILTGDAHSSWGLDIARDPFDTSDYDPATGRGSLAVEIIVPGVTSPGVTDRELARASDERYLATHPHLVYANQYERGYALVDVTHERVRAEWYFVSSVREPAAGERLGAAAVSSSGQNHLTLPASLEAERPPADAAAPAPA